MKKRSLLSRLTSTKRFKVELNGEPYRITLQEYGWGIDNWLPTFQSICAIVNEKTGEYQSTPVTEYLDDFNFKEIIERILWCVKHKLTKALLMGRNLS